MKLFFVTGLRAGEELEFAIPEITIGRELDNVVNIPVEGVSRHHGKFSRKPDGRWFVEDTGSTNGIKCNRVKINGAQELREGDLIEFGNQMIRVTGLAAAPKPIDLGGLDDPEDGPSAEINLPPSAAHPQTGSPGTEASAFPSSPTIPIPLDPAPLPPSEPAPAEAGKTISVNEISEALKNGKLHLFGGKSAAGAAESSAPKTENGGKDGGKRKPLFTNRLYYTLIGCMVIMGIAWFHTTAKKSPAAAPAGNQQDAWGKRFLLFYEKNIVTADNVFYFVLHIENGMAKFQIDDLKSSRSFVRDNIPFSPDSYEIFHAELEQSNFFSSQSPASAPGSTGEQDIRRMVICDRGRLHEIMVKNNMRPRAFENLERVINIFAENYALRTVSMTPEELQELAALNFDKAEELFQNREARPANLRSAIDRYRLAVEYLDAFVPRPTLWDRARKQLERAERIRKDRIAALKNEQKIMALSHPNTPEFNNARKNLIDIDSYLRKSGGRK